MGRPRKLEQLTQPLSGRVRNDQHLWLKMQADRRFDGEMSRTLRWALEQAQVLTWMLDEPDPVQAMDEMLHPEKYEIPHPEEMIAEAERELEEWKRQQAVKRVQRKANK
jgi:hypothetical protein